MAISGRLAAAARAGLQEIQAANAQKDALAQQQAQQQFINDLRLREIANAERAQAQAVDDRAATRRMQTNQMGLEQMNLDAQRMGAEEAQRADAALVRSVLENPDISDSVKRMAQIGGAKALRTLDPKALRSTAEIEADTARDVSRAGAISAAQAREAARFRQSDDKAEWVIGADGEVARRVPRAGDRPYDKKGDGSGQADFSSAYSDERTKRAIDAIDAVLPNIGRSTAGPAALMANVPGTPAYKVRAQLSTLQAQIIMQELNEMRSASKTGGALGQVSDREGERLANAMGAIDQGLDPDDLRTQLGIVKQSLQRWNEAKKRVGGGGRPGMASSHDGASSVAVGTERLINGTPAVWDGHGWVRK